MTSSYQTFGKGFLQGSVLGFVLFAIGFLGWLFAILVGVEKDSSLRGISLMPLYVLSFALGGGIFTLLRGESPKLYESVLAWVSAAIIVLLGCGIMFALLESGKPIEWFWGASSFIILCVLCVVSLVEIKRNIKPKDALEQQNVA
jgi:peptidoglycan/LPS O-acetylase OafA/YrhL